ncbi:MAG: palindromic element RPE4 domain-containing protein [Janthinobacterium lividum]
MFFLFLLDPVVKPRDDKDGTKICTTSRMKR